MPFFKLAQLLPLRIFSPGIYKNLDWFPTGSYEFGAAHVRRIRTTGSVAQEIYRIISPVIRQYPYLSQPIIPLNGDNFCAPKADFERFQAENTPYDP